MMRIDLSIELLVGTVSAFLFLGLWYWLTKKIIRKLPVEGEEMKLNPIETFEHKDGCEATGFRSHRNIKYLQSRGLCICDPLPEWNEPVVTKVVRHRYEVDRTEGFITANVHNWDGKSFDKQGYPVADCGARLYPKYMGYDGQSNVCEVCFK